MTHEAQDTGGPSSTSPRHRRGNGRRAFKAGLFVLAIGAAAFAGAAYGQMRDGFGRWHGMDKEQSMGAWASGERHAMAIDFMLYRVNASPAQRRQIEAVAQQAQADMKEFHLELPALMETFAEELAKPALDRAAIEALRARQLALADLASLHLVDALADAAEILTPEQRVKLATDLKRMPHRHR